MNAIPRQLIWILCLLLVLGVHGGMAAWALYWQVETPPLELPPAAMLVELAPLPPAVAAPPPPPPPPPQVEPETPKPLPKLAEAPKPALALPPPKPRPKPQPPQPKPQPPKPVEPAPTPQPPAPPAPAEPAPAPVEQAPPAPTNTVSQAEVVWSNKLTAHLRRYLKYPDAARRSERLGSVRHVTLRFTVNAQGEVTDYSVVKSANSALFDRASLQMIRRAQPLPKPPAEVLSNGLKEVTFPHTYELTR
ncbi:MAG: energy transducer TonB [Pseudomonas sp.]|uniref:energy transducer TonB family protein n=1 Tax=Pseudomonas sp. TaxID=306 RepID=UPI003395625C